MAATIEETFQRPVGELLRGWRERRRLSQLELANRVEVSTRHVSFVETGRSKPSREMVMRLAEHLDVPLRDRNQLLLAGGFAPIYSEASLHSPSMLAIRTTLRRLLKAHEPYPALVVDRWWNIVEANAGIAIFTTDVDEKLLQAPINALRLTLHPDGLARRIANIAEVRSAALASLQRQVAGTADPELQDLYDELRTYAVNDMPAPPGPAEVVVPFNLTHDGRELSLLTTIATFGTPLDVTVSELMIESFYPADDATAKYLRALS
ncbi:DNA-binding XRE family transcriptional regulator [Kribbella sp. VKM Ac-2569]|uniref:helix-turn-helix domain-containing protein n=1 Tax=Kribbella sp. VKM Ac-2569 TaxID=2512220 RepID=UPI00102AA8D9|nr:helix-turn-helix transcriptional regulator [Kribbella sp. VKM Ac-2569]RZT15162.1 DNA-binding XRE family transcriptional regulator [Kribbella sp. VKM Ac-2569]